MLFALTYLRQELRRRMVRTLLTAMGLASGVSLVTGIIGVSQGLDRAQQEVLSPLHSVGTDILVTRIVGVNNGQTPGTTGASGAGGNPTTQQNAFFAGQAGGINQQDVTDLLSDNSSLITDLSALGKPGDKFTRDFFLPATLLTFPDQAVPDVTGIPHVTEASGALSLLATHQTGTVPQIVATLQTQAQTYQATARPAPMTSAEITDFQACTQAQGGAPGGPGGGRFDPTRTSAFTACLPERFRQYVASITVPAQTIQQVLNPPKTDITATSYTAGGVDTNHPGTGLITQGQIVKGSFFTPGTQTQIILSSAYADKQKLDVGGTTVINGTTFTIVGLANPTLSGNTDDIYLPLDVLQKLASKTTRINTVLVRVDDSSQVEGVAAAIRTKLPGAQVITTDSLAKQVTGSLSQAKNLVDSLSGALTAIVLGGAFLIAILLTLAGISKRVREIGTLRAIGWRRSMVVRQIVMETIVIGLIGGVIGVAGGLAVDAAVGKFSPSFTVGNVATLGQGSSQFTRFLGDAGTQVRNDQDAARQEHIVRIIPPFDLRVILLGVGFALVGGLLAGAVGGWRATRLQPADALRDLG